jgi:trimethylamine:corrinoid methyltransferase-like protein
VTQQIPIEALRPTIRMLSDQQILAIHHNSLDILSRTGIVMKNESACAGRSSTLGPGSRTGGSRSPSTW